MTRPFPAARLVAAILVSTSASISSASAEDRIWPLIGMGGAEAARLLEGKCPTLWQPAPYITCIDGEHVITATSSDKDRIRYIQRLEPTDMGKEAYAAAVAAELGFDGEGAPCDRHGTPAICWTKPDGTQLFAAMDFNPGVLATQIVNDAVKAEDNGP